MTAGSGPGAACTACSAPFDTRSRAHRLTCFARCRSRLFRIRGRKTVWDGARCMARRPSRCHRCSIHQYGPYHAREGHWCGPFSSYLIEQGAHLGNVAVLGEPVQNNPDPVSCPLAGDPG